MIASDWQTPVPDWSMAGLNLCNSLSGNVVISPYASASGPLFGAPASVQQRGFGSQAV